MPLSEKNRSADKESEELDQRFVKFKHDPANHDFRDQFEYTWNRDTCDGSEEYFDVPLNFTTFDESNPYKLHIAAELIVFNIINHLKSKNFIVYHIEA